MQTWQSQAPGEPASSDIHLYDLFVVMAQNARLLVIAPIVVGILAYLYALTMAPTFTASARIIPPQQPRGAAAALQAQLGALAGLAGSVGVNIKDPVDTYVALIRSRTVADALVDRFDLQKIYQAKLREDARAVLARLTRVAAGKDGLITIEVDDSDPARAASIANAYVEAATRLTGSLALTEAQQRRTFFESQLKQTQANLKASELALGQTGAGEALLKSAPGAVVDAMARLKAQVTAQEIRISTMRGYLAESSPEFLLAQRELASLRQQLALAQRDEPGKDAASSDYLNRYRDFKYQETLFELMAKQYEAARLDEAREGALIQVVDPAVPPERRSRPKRVLFAATTAFAVGLGLLLFVFLRLYVRVSRNDPRFAAMLEQVSAGVGRALSRRKA
jgi:tyrosine-protein kinase Etk/Wzc